MESSTVADRGQVKWSVKWNKHLEKHLTPLFLDHIMAWYFHTLTLKFVDDALKCHYLMEWNFFVRVLDRLIKYFLGFYKWKLNFFVIIFLWPCLVVRKRQDTKIRKTDKKNQQNNQENQTKICFSVFCFLFYFLNPSITYFFFSPASFI